MADCFQLPLPIAAKEGSPRIVTPAGRVSEKFLSVKVTSSGDLPNNRSPLGLHLPVELRDQAMRPPHQAETSRLSLGGHLLGKGCIHLDPRGEVIFRDVVYLQSLS